jgi:RNA polymerase sigma factor (sigma-70 family)
MPVKALTEEQRALAARYVPFAKSLARKWAGACPTRADDISSAAMLALVTSARDYDPSRGIQFSTFAGHRIRGEIRNVFGRDSEGIGGVSFRLEAGLPVPRCRAVALVTGGTPIAAGHVPKAGAEMIERDAVEGLLRRLPAKNRDPLRLMAFEGISRREAATRLGWSDSEVCRLVKQSRQLLGGTPCSS